MLLCDINIALQHGTSYIYFYFAYKESYDFILCYGCAVLNFLKLYINKNKWIYKF